MIKNIYEKPRSNILFNGERLKAFLPPKMRTKTRMPAFTTAIRHCTKSSSQGY